MEREVQLVGQSWAFLDAVERASRAALMCRPVLVVGERGTGKELIAERLHRLSDRWGEALVVLNCAALPETLIEAELFGHEQGAFTGATRARAGKFEEADGGTLFLDELATLSISAQERLLRVVEDGLVTRLGASRPVKVDVRIVAATNADLPAMVEAGLFRADLLDRLSFDVITLPPLRAREGDVRVLADYFGRRMAAELLWEEWPGFSPEALAVLEQHDWPGNLRELRNVAERAVYRWDHPHAPVAELQLDPFVNPWGQANDMAGGVSATVGAGEALGAAVSEVALRHNPAAQLPELSQVTDLRAAVDAHERAIVLHHLTACRWNQRRTAKALGLSYDQLRHIVRKHGLAEEVSAPN